MKIWIDDIRKPPDRYSGGWIIARSVEAAKVLIKAYELIEEPIEVIDLDHDAGTMAAYGGDYIELLNWFEETVRSYPIRIHSMNPVGVQNMRAIIQKNGWREVYNV